MRLSGDLFTTQGGKIVRPGRKKESSSVECKKVGWFLNQRAHVLGLNKLLSIFKVYKKSSVHEVK